MTRIRLHNANNMPLQAPLIPDPFVPYDCPANRSLNAICQGDATILGQYLENTPFTLTGDRFLVYVSDFTNCNKTPFMDAGIVIPVRFGECEGGYFLFEYEDNEAAIAAGRDLWGYPKKFGTIELTEREGGATASVVRNGVPLISIDCRFDEVEREPLKTTPHLNIHIQPAPDGTILNKRVIARDTSPDFRQTSCRWGSAQVSLGTLPTDPLAPLGPVQVFAANYVIGDFFATEENGWGTTIADLVVNGHPSGKES
ncbi:acetoacetate decarboxylase family protein [Mesorhizobium sp. BAC0120]|uniref:acetoacetate decarboxylase family protein n=1 Tax=Mesorhizobium sp. BAC0120 TaxID=3090670 RepID=UPI00298D47FF|nr:acetoacetate decarboxylase family protein [Mesorhizobium sp. BAC0120]MDW6021848.1 acetoacetate decarboxylase family protein [Mesorhizobium sp. BAC0120]